MNKVKIVITAMVIMWLAACGDSSNPPGRSTPIDSTNVYGTAAAQYEHDDPADTTQTTTGAGDTSRDPGLSNSAPDLYNKPGR